MWIPLKGFAQDGLLHRQDRGIFPGRLRRALRKVSVTPTTVCDKSWQPSDGMVNVVSGRWPYHLPGRQGGGGRPCLLFRDRHRYKTGVWYVLPVQPLDHVSFAGSFFNEGILSTHMLYQGIMKQHRQLRRLTILQKFCPPARIFCTTRRLTKMPARCYNRKR
jgi:hypothetical protein